MARPPTPARAAPNRRETIMQTWFRRCSPVGLLLGALIALALAAGGVAPAAPPVMAQSGELVIFAAASLTDAFNELGGIFEAQQVGSRVRFNYGASSQLRTQLDQGARGDVFASADTVQMDQARAAGLVAGAAPVF